MESLATDLMNIINQLGASEVQNLLNGVINRANVGVEEAGSKLDSYMKMDGELVGTQKRLVKNVIITSPTQVGKTKYVIDACKRSENLGQLIVISCDNSLVQLNQLKSRLLEAGVCHYPVTKASVAVVGGILANGKSVVIVMLNNVSQICKLSSLINGIGFVSCPSRFIFFHDEADMLNKSDNVDEISKIGVPLSHRRWVGLMDTLEKTCIPTNRFWISATPENCSSISRVSGADILVLPPVDTYRGVSDHIDWSPDDLENDYLGDEIERIREITVEFSGEVILYCVDRINTGQDQLARGISEKYNCITCSYNMGDIILYQSGSVLRGVIGKKDSISVVLDKTREICLSENAPMVIVGYNLMNRGVSFVAEGYNPPTATVMFYHGGVKSHVVGLAQRFGRITGTSRPDISRRIVYCSSAVYRDYTGYLANQNLVWNALSDVENNGRTICSILSSIEGVVPLSRPLDRPTLKSVNSEYSDSCSSDSDSVGSSSFDENKMKRLVNSWKLIGNNTAIARVFRRMMGCGGKMESTLVREYFTSSGAIDALVSNHNNGWNLIFKKDSRYHYIRQEALDYYNTL